LGLSRTSAGSLLLDRCAALILEFAAIETYGGLFVRRMGTSVNHRYMLSVKCGRPTYTSSSPSC
jgi:hypothetical protein